MSGRRKKTPVFERFSSSPGFNTKKTLGSHKRLPKAPEPVKQEVFSFHGSDTSENIIFAEEQVNGKPQVKAGTLEKLVQRLTHEEHLDPTYNQTFLLTYRTFTSPNQLLNILKARFHMKPPADAPKDWYEKAQTPIRLRVFNALKNWLLKGFYDFADNPKLRKNFLHFLDEMATEMASASKNLRNVFDRQMNEARKGREIIFSKKPPVPIIPRSLVTEPTLIDFSPLEIARQLTLIESELYRAIKPWELLNQSWAKKDKEKRAPRVLAMINRFNTVSNWVATIIVQTSDLKARVALQKHIIEIAHHCLSLNNFNAVMEIISGLQASSVYRLKQTRAQIDSKHTKMLEECETVMCRDQNFKNFRAHLHSADPPSIPYLGVYLTDLTFIEDGNSDNVANGLINFVKRQQVFGVINEVQQYQYSPYCLEKVEFITDWLLDVKSIPEEECYKLSMIIEPRGFKPPEQSSSKRKITLSRQNSISFRKGSTLSPRDRLHEADNPYQTPYGELELVKGYLFYDKDSPSNIIVKQEGDQTIIEGGTLPKLVERLTHEKYPDINYLNAFLMTFRSFTTPSDLLDLLINRFFMPHPKSPTKEQERNFRAEKLIPIHFRVFNVLKEWITKYGIDFKQDTVLVQRVLDFATKVKTEYSTLAQGAKTVIDAVNQTFPSVTEPHLIAIGTKPVESPQTTFMDIDIDKLCNQLFSFVCGTFGNAEPREYVQAQWKVPEGRFQCLHLQRLYNHSRDFKLWIKTELIRSPDVPTRASVLGKFIHMADKFSKLSDMFHCFVIIITLEEMRDNELCITWEWLSPRYLSVWSRLQQLKRKTEQQQASEPTTPTTRARSQTKAAPPAFVPFLDPILDNIESISKLNDYCGADDLINFSKRQQIYFVFLPIAQHALGCAAAEKISLDKDIRDYLKGVTLLQPEEMKAAVASMNNQRPEGLPPSEQEKNAVIKNTEGSIDDSIKPLLMQLIGNDSTFREFVLSQLSNQIQTEAVENVKKEMTKFARISKLLLSLVLAREQRNREIEVDLTSQIAKEQYPNSKVELWSKVDTNSSVFGWEEEIRLVIIENEDEKAIVHARYNAKKADIATLLRMLQFYQEENDDTTTFCSLIVMGIEKEAMEIATTNNISVTKM